MNRSSTSAGFTKSFGEDLTARHWPLQWWWAQEGTLPC